MKNSSFRIRTTPGVDKNINVALEQDYDFLEILSLKISQQDLYQSFCADYGVLVGRVIANEGFGVPNAKVSVFIPISNEDEKNELISSLYPYKTVNSLNEDGVRYNLLLEESTCNLTTPVGTFPSKSRLLEHDIWVEIYEKYYKYTTTTNDAGDYIIFGIPTGQQTIHMDVDLSDIGFLSLRPYDLKRQGYPETLFNGLEFKVSTNLDELPQIRTQNKSVDIQPFWGDKDICTIGISRVDFNIGNDLGANAIFMGSIFTDSDDNALKHNCDVRRKMGEQGQLITGAGKVDIIKANVDETSEPTSLEFLPQQEIDEDGAFVFTLPMYYDKVITDEFGEIVESPDPTKGIPTKGKYRFKLKFNDAATIDKKRTITTASLIVPSLHERFSGIRYTNKSKFTINNDYLNQLKSTPNLFNYEFHTFEWKQIYTTTQYIKKNLKLGNRFEFIGLKDCGPMDFTNQKDDDNDNEIDDDSTNSNVLSLPYTTGIKRFGNRKFKLCFHDAWLNGGNYMFKFTYKNKNNGGFKYCGPTTGFDDSNKKNCRCDGSSEVNKDPYLNDCIVISPNFIKGSDGTIYTSDSNGASDTNEFIYCNFGLSTKIINIGIMSICGELLDDLKNINTTSYLKKYDNTIGMGTGKESGLDIDGVNVVSFDDGSGAIIYPPNPTPTIDILPTTSYKDARPLINFFSDNKKGKLPNNRFQDGDCYEEEFKFWDGSDIEKSVGYYTKEMCKIHIEVFQTNPDPDGGTRVNVGGTPFAGYSTNNPVFNRFSKVKTYATPIGRSQLDSRNREKLNNPYFYFGLNPGKTALDKLRKNYF